MKVVCMCRPTFEDAASNLNEIIKDRNVEDMELFAYGDNRCICVLMY